MWSACDGGLVEVGDESGARLRQTGVGSGSVALPLGNWEDVTPSVWGRDPTRVSRRRPAGREMGARGGAAGAGLSESCRAMGAWRLNHRVALCIEPRTSAIRACARNDKQHATNSGLRENYTLIRTNTRSKHAPDPRRRARFVAISTATTCERGPAATDGRGAQSPAG